jgi:hypothetical protein
MKVLVFDGFGIWFVAGSHSNFAVVPAATGRSLSLPVQQQAMVMHDAIHLFMVGRFAISSAMLMPENAPYPPIAGKRPATASFC